LVRYRGAAAEQGDREQGGGDGLRGHGLPRAWIRLDLGSDRPGLAMPGRASQPTARGLFGRPQIDPAGPAA
jgi:hypothetical protein